MSNKILYSLLFLSIIQIGKAQQDHANITDALNNFNGNFENVGTARFLGMAGSMGALGGDLSAVEVNPAGLGIFRNSDANMSLGVLSNKNKASMTNSYSNSDTYFTVPSGGVAFALGETSPLNINFGINYSYQRLDNEVVFSENPNFDYTHTNQIGTPRDYHMNGYNEYTNGYKSKVKFSVAGNYEDQFYFGLGLDWHFADVEKSHYYSHKDNSDYTTYYDQQYTPYRVDADGFGLNVGVIAKVTQQFRLGAAYHSPVWWSGANMDYIEYYEDKDNPDFNFISGYYDRNKLTAPGKVVLSAAFASNIINDDNSLAINFDFINHFNQDYKFKSPEDQIYRENNVFVDRYMKDNQEYRGGIEYRYKNLKLRGGYAYTSSPIKDKTINGMLVNGGESNYTEVYKENYLAGDRSVFALGVGYDIGAFYLDLAYQLLTSKYYTAIYGDYYNTSLYDQNASGDDSYGEHIQFNDPIWGKVKNTQNNFVLTFGFRF